jgi:hypothetical protein
MNNLIIKKKTLVDPVLELYRGKIYCNIINYFIYIITKHLDKNIFNIKKSFQRTLTNILSSWLFTLYSTNTDIESDVFIPSNFKDTSILELTLMDFTKYDTTIENPKEKVQLILEKFTEYYSEQYKNLINYKKSQFYLNEKTNYTITKKFITQDRNSNKVGFYKYNIKIYFGIKNEKLDNILNNILIPTNIYNKMVSTYTGNKEIIDDLIWSIIFRYQLLGSNNHQLGILPNIIDNMVKDYNTNFECFASSINFTLNKYCSVYHDLEQYFGSQGNFFNTEISEGSYTFNPPYQKKIIDDGIYKILNSLKKAKEQSKNLSFFLTIPVWDKDGQKELSCENKIDYGDFEIINIVKNSEFLKKIRIINKEQFTYIDHNFQLYKNKTIQHTYFIVLSNTNQDFNKIDSYNFYE